MGVILPSYLNADTGAVTTNAYVSLMTNSVPIHAAMSPPFGSIRGMRGNSSNVPPWFADNTADHASIVLRRDASGAYFAIASMFVFASRDARGQGRSHIDNLLVSAPCDLNCNIATAVYADLKAQYPGAVDA